MEQKVSQISLDKLKENNQNDIKNIYNNIESLLLEPKVIEYLRNCKLLEEKQSFDSFLNGLELGEDGTLFNKYDDNKQNGLSSTHYGLSIILRNAFRILLDNDIKSVSYDSILKYITNAEEKLHRMKYMEGDKSVSNKYGVVVYENPKNYSLVDFKQIIPTLTQRKLEMSYNLTGIVVNESARKFESLDDISFDDKFNLSSREQEAFFGDDALLSLGIKKNIKEKVFKK